MQIIAGSRENYPAVNAIFLAVKHHFFLQNVFKCCQKIVIYLFHLFTPSNLGIACQRHARVGLRPKYLPIIARFPPVKNFSYIPASTGKNPSFVYNHQEIWIIVIQALVVERVVNTIHWINLYLMTSAVCFVYRQSMDNNLSVRQLSTF